MSKNIDQVYMANPITTNASTDLMYFGQSPYGANNDAAMTYVNFAAQFGAPFTPSALTATPDTNVTITLGGTPTTALLHASSITLGWTGTLSGTRGGTGVNNGANTITLGGNVLTAGALTLAGAFPATFNFSASTNVTFPTSGTLSTTTGTVTSVSGTTNRITSTGGATPVIDISASYVGQSSITTLGTITTGVWTGTTIAIANGGTGITSFGTGVQTALGQNVTGSGGIVLATSPTITTPVIAQINDTNGNPIMGTVPQALAVNYLSINNSVTLGNPSFSAVGTDTNIGITLLAKAAGVFTVQTTASASAFQWLTGTARQHTTALTFANTAASQVITVPDVTGTMTVLGNTSTGSGSVVLATSPTLVTPVLGAATATSINFGGSSLSTYVTGTWTPTDGSGAGLSFTGANGTYTQIGNVVIASCTVTYPSTVNANSAIIAGLPVTTGSTGQKMGGNVVFTTVATLAHAWTLTSTATFALYTTAGANVLNSAMTGSTNTFQVIYFI